MDKVRHAVIGLGWFGEKHCEVLAARMVREKKSPAPIENALEIIRLLEAGKNRSLNAARPLICKSSFDNSVA